MKTLIIGCGYIGSAVLGQLNSAGDEVAVTTTSEARVSALEPVAKEVYVLRGDDEELLLQALHGKDRVVVTVAPKERGQYEHTYLRTAETLARCLEKVDSVKQLVYTSSTSVYGDHEGEWVREDSELRPMNESGRILQKTEETYLRLADKGIKVSILRLAGLYGPEREVQDRLKQIQGRVLPGSANGYTNWTHRDDAASAVAWVLSNRLEGVYNVCGDTHTPKGELYTKICEKHAIKVPTWDADQPAFHGGNRRVANDKLKATGFAFEGAGPV